MKLKLPTYMFTSMCKFLISPRFALQFVILKIFANCQFPIDRDVKFVLQTLWSYISKSLRNNFYVDCQREQLKVCLKKYSNCRSSVLEIVSLEKA